MLKILLPLIFACTACTSEASAPPVPPAPVPVAQAAPAPAPAAPVPANAPAPSQAPAPGQGDLLAQIRALIGNASCTDGSQCRTLPIGARACGGPEGYLAYSTSSAPEAELKALAERHKQERADFHAKSGMMSNCRYMPDPGAVCVAGTCQLATGKNPAV
jgi:hypothetical protein